MAPTHSLQGRGSGWGTCGELAQGRLADGRHFHLTCPIQKSATATLQLDTTATGAECGIYGLGQDKHKTLEALRIASEMLDIPRARIDVQSWSDLDVAKGMGSSTADICAAVRALADAIGVPMPSQELARIAVQVESSDGTMYPGVNLVDHKTGQLLWELSHRPELVVLMLIPPATYSTESISFDGQSTRLNEYEQLLDQIRDAQMTDDAATWCAIATASANINQQWVPNALFGLLGSRWEELGALGVNVGHTGTMAGLLYANDHSGRQTAAQAMMQLQELVPSGVRVEMTRTVSAAAPGDD